MAFSTPSTASPVAEYYDATVGQYLRRWCAGTACCHLGYADNNARSHRHQLLNTVYQLIRVSGLHHAAYREPLRPLQILDAGCGLGGGAGVLAQALHADVVGVSLSWHQIAYAMRRYRTRSDLPRGQQPFGQIRFDIQNYTDTTFHPHRFDAVVYLESACHSNVAAILPEAARILKPSGRLIIADGWLLDPAISQSSTYQSWQAAWAIDQLYTADQWRSVGLLAEWELVAQEDWTAAMTPSIHRLGHRCRRALPVASWLTRHGRMSEAARQNVIGGQLWDTLVHHQGACGYGITVFQKPEGTVHG